MLTPRGIAVAVTMAATYVAAVVLHYAELGVLAAGGLLVLLLGVAWVVRRPHVQIVRTIEPARVTRWRTGIWAAKDLEPRTDHRLAYDRRGALRS